MLCGNMLLHIFASITLQHFWQANHNKMSHELYKDLRACITDRQECKQQIIELGRDRGSLVAEPRHGSIKDKCRAIEKRIKERQKELFVEESRFTRAERLSECYDANDAKGASKEYRLIADGNKPASKCKHGLEDWEQGFSRPGHEGG